MKRPAISSGAKNAIAIGGLCSVSYLAVYIARNVLGSAAPQMIQQGVLTEGQIGTLSSVYFISYAIGQLINGVIGDKIKSKYMIGLGLIFAGICNMLFAAFSASNVASVVTYAMTGFALAMIYAPMTKVVAENTEPIYATRCSLGYTFASFLGSPIAGILAAFLVWQAVFFVSSGALIGMGILCLVLFTRMERKGLITYGKFDKAKESGGSVKLLLERGIVQFTIVAMLTGVVRTTVVFWLPTFLSQYAGFSPKTAALLYTVATFAVSSSAFLAVLLYECIGRKMNMTMLLSFVVSALGFLAVYWIKAPVASVLFMVVAITAANCAANILWSVYCPGLRDTGMVSGATGFLDFASYMAAAVSSAVFSNAVTQIGWGPLILVWFGLMACGVVTTIIGKRESA